MAVDLKQSYRRLLEESFGKGNYSVYDEICGSGYVSHDPVTGDSDLAKAREVARGYKTAFPDLTPTILAAFVQENTVVLQWRMVGTHRASIMGIQPTGNRCTVDGISIGRFKAGKLVEDWVQWDALGLMRQLGVAPNVGATKTNIQEKRTHA